MSRVTRVTRVAAAAPLIAALLLAAGGGGSSSTVASSPPSATHNKIATIVGAGPAGVNAVNTLYTTV